MTKTIKNYPEYQKILQFEHDQSFFQIGIKRVNSQIIEVLATCDGAKVHKGEIPASADTKQHSIELKHDLERMYDFKITKNLT